MFQSRAQKTRGKDNISRGKPSSSFKEMHHKPNLNFCIQIIILSQVLGDHWANATGEEMDLNPHIPKVKLQC